MKNYLPNSKLGFENTLGGIRITLPGQKYWKLIFILSIMAVIQGAVVILSMGIIAQGILEWIDNKELDSLIGGMLIGGTYLIVLISFSNSIINDQKILCWQLFGCEVIDINGLCITINQKMVFRNKSFEYTSGLIKNLHVVEPEDVYNFFSITVRGNFRPGSGSLTFDYGDAKIRFGTGLAQDQAERLLKEIVVQFPIYQEPVTMLDFEN